jgi:hypothetical protein
MPNSDTCIYKSGYTYTYTYTYNNSYAYKYCYAYTIPNGLYLALYPSTHA